MQRSDEEGRLQELDLHETRDLAATRDLAKPPAPIACACWKRLR